MSPEQSQDNWDRAQKLEAAGALDEARAEYSKLLDAHWRPLMVRLRLSSLEQAAGRYVVSRAHALAAAQELGQVRRWEALPYVTLRLLAFDERRLVRSVVLGADWSSPQVLAQAPALAQHLSLCGHDEDALRLLDASEQRARPSHLIEYARASAARNLGRTEEATAALERSIALSPSFPYAHWSLAYHAPPQRGENRVPRIRQALADPRQDALARAHLHYALFKELDTAGELDAAWSELQSGASLMRGLQPAGASRVEAAAAEALLAGSDYRPHAAPPSGESARVPIFIVGMPRTGTTVLERILGGHPRVADAGELNDFQHAASLACDRFVQLPFGSGDLNALARVDAEDIGRHYLERTGWRYAGKSHLVDKNPQNFHAAGLIAHALPQARILCLVRDPVDACFSNLKEVFAPGSYPYSYDLQELADHYARFHRLLGHWREVLRGQFLEVGYEELVTRPEQVTEKVLRFCGLPPDPACADITRNLSRSDTASNSQVRQPIHAGHVGAWQRYRQPLQPLLDGLRAHGLAPGAGP